MRHAIAITIEGDPETLVNESLGGVAIAIGWPGSQAALTWVRDVLFDPTQ
jgi:hypothetical protein